MALGDTTTISINYYPVGSNYGIPDEQVTWTAADTSVIAISPNGPLSATITATKIGTTSITARLGGFVVSTLVIVDNENIISDNNFMQYCITHFDANGDKIIQGTEVSKVIGLDVSELAYSCGKTIPISLKGIEMFENLRSFKASHILISDLDLSHNKRLTELDLSQSEIAMLDLSKNPQLRFVDCHACPSLATIYFGSADDGEYFLNSINCRNCALTSIDLSRCKRLAHIDCSNNQLQQLDISNNPLLDQLSCTGNQLTTIKISSELNIDSIKTFIKTLDIDEGVTFTY